jgi:predicted HTH transcriptional regulator
MAEIADNIGISQSTVEKTIKKLKEENILKRMGSTKAGYWEIDW